MSELLEGLFIGCAYLIAFIAILCVLDIAMPRILRLVGRAIRKHEKRRLKNDQI